MLWKLWQVLKQKSRTSTASQLGPSWLGGLGHGTVPTGTPWSRSLFPVSFKTLMKEFVKLPRDKEYCFRNSNQKASLVAQWWRICLPMQETQVRSLVREDPTRHRAAKPMHCNYWTCALEPRSHSCWAYMPQLPKPAGPIACVLQQEKPLQWEARVLQLERSPHSQKLEIRPCSKEDSDSHK